MNEEWRERAACRGMDVGLFFVERGDVHQGRAVCASCPVRAECLDHALVTVERHGLWGGESERGRRRLRRDLPPGSCVDCGVPAGGRRTWCEECGQERARVGSMMRSRLSRRVAG